MSRRDTSFDDEEDVMPQARNLQYPSEQNRKFSPLTIGLVVTIVALLIALVICVAFTITYRNEANALNARKAKAERLIKNTRELYADVVWPKSAEIVRNGTLPPFFKKGAKGRINPVGTFDDAEETIEYFYALAGPVVGDGKTGIRCIKTEIIKIEASGDDRVAVRVDLLFERPELPITSEWHFYNLTQVGFITFDSVTEQVISYDMEILNMGIPPTGIPDAQLIQILCNSIQVACANNTTGNNQQYDSVAECVDYLTNKIPFGSFWTAGSNSVACRSIHVELAFIRPQVHCVHVGPTGGTKCHDFPYRTFYEENY